MSTHNIGFNEEISKNYLLISIKYHLIFFCGCQEIIMFAEHLKNSHSSSMQTKFEPRHEKKGFRDF